MPSHFIASCAGAASRRDRASEEHPLRTHLHQFLAYLPAKYAGIFLAQLIDSSLDLRRRHLRLGAANHARPNRARLLVAIQYLGHTAMRNSQLSRYHTGPYSAGRHFNYLQAYVVGQWATVDEDAAQLIDASLA